MAQTRSVLHQRPVFSYVLSVVGIDIRPSASLQEVSELDLAEREGLFLTAETAEEKLAPALAAGAKISKASLSLLLTCVTQ